MRKLKNSNQGFVSITVTLIIILILSLLVIGFAQIVRREQRQALDRQLNTQAFYAAESGVNDAKEALNNNEIVGDRTDCNAPLTASMNNNIDGTGNVSYTCLLIKKILPTLEFTEVGIDKSEVFVVQGDGGQSINSITFNWQGKDFNKSAYNDSDCPSNGTLPPTWGNCKAGILRIDLVPYDAAKSRANLIDQTFTTFMHPRGLSAQPFDYAGGIGLTGQGAIIDSDCSSSNSATYACSATVNGLGATAYYIRVRSVYLSSVLSVSAQSGGVSIMLSGSQAEIDSTGRANDVLRRIKVRVPIRQFGDFPENALQTEDSQCKRYSVIPSANQITVQSTENACRIE